jgi:hypothetical protein
MKRFIGLCLWFYTAGLRLYPGEFQAQFAGEMQAVFAELLGQAAPGGLAGVIRLCLRELSDLPISLLREHWRYGQEVNVNTLRFPSHSIRWGAVGFGIAFALVRSAQFAWGHGGPASLYVYVLAGAAGGALFGLATQSRKQLGLLALVGALAFAVGHLVAMYLVSIWFVRLFAQDPPQGSAVAAAAYLLAYSLEPLVVGALVGLLIGGIQKNIQRAIRTTLVCAAGFGVGQIVGFGASLAVWGMIQAIDSWRPAYNGQLSPWVISFGNGGWFVVASIVSGILGGAAAGRILKRPAPDHSDAVPG